LGRPYINEQTQGTMKKIKFNSHKDLKEAIAVLEKHNIDFTWDMYDYRHVLHLGHANIDHVKLALQNLKVPHKIIDF
jgi:hypothetical protein